jgi:hypothetical protein
MAILALRHAFATPVNKNGVAPRMAQAAMRHSSLDLTMNVYTDPTLLDVAGALATLPELSLEGAVESTPTTHTRAAERLAMRAQKARLQRPPASS